MGPMSDAVNRWTPSGNPYFWRYLENVRNYPGWHFALDPAAIGSISVLLEAMLEANSPSYRTLPVVPPPAPLLSVPNNKSGLAKWQSPSKLRIRFAPSNATAWAFSGDAAIVEWSIGNAHVPNTADAFRNPMKYFDTTIGKEPRLWSWGVFIPDRSQS
jgi:hypothetical protein